MTDVGIPAFMRKRLELVWTKWNRYCARSLIFSKAEKNRHSTGLRPELPSPEGRCLKRIASRIKENPMKVSEIMTRDVFLASPGQKLREVAAEMEKHDIGLLPVGDKDRLVGMITDRDIAVRGMSHGLC